MNLNNKLPQNHRSFIVLFICFFSVHPIYAQISINEAINIAGKQRMLTQRMLKNYAMVGMGNDYGDPAKDLQHNIQIFDEAYQNLKALQINSDVNKSLNDVEQLWHPIKKIIQTKPEKEKIAKLQKALDALLSASHKTTNMITKASNKGSSEIINISGRQRMLSQRMAALYMLKVWGLDDPEFINKLNDSMDEFSKAQDTLLKSSINTPEISVGLAKVKKSFKWFEVMGRSKSGRYAPTIISKSADKILKEMDRITDLYSKSAN